MKMLLVSLLILLALCGGWLLGVRCTIYTIKTRYPTTWTLLGLEMKNNKQKQVEAACDKEAQP
ncbi:MAG: hypothetical protein IJ418_01680 [Clostridia bacterium]|nr:hypothetical protein [Clostridia bacterium]